MPLPMSLPAHTNLKFLKFTSLFRFLKCHMLVKHTVVIIRALIYIFQEDKHHAHFTSYPPLPPRIEGLRPTGPKPPVSDQRVSSHRRFDGAGGELSVRRQNLPGIG